MRLFACDVVSQCATLLFSALSQESRKLMKSLACAAHRYDHGNASLIPAQHAFLKPESTSKYYYSKSVIKIHYIVHCVPNSDGLQPNSDGIVYLFRLSHNCCSCQLGLIRRAGGFGQDPRLNMHCTLGLHVLRPPGDKPSF